MNMYVVFWTTKKAQKNGAPDKMKDKFQVVESLPEAKSIYESKRDLDSTWCAGYAPIKDSTDWS